MHRVNITLIKWRQKTVTSGFWLADILIKRNLLVLAIKSTHYVLLILKEDKQLGILQAYLAKWLHTQKKRQGCAPRLLKTTFFKPRLQQSFFTLHLLTRGAGGGWKTVGLFVPQLIAHLVYTEDWDRGLPHSAACGQINHAVNPFHDHLRRNAV